MTLLFRYYVYTNYIKNTILFKLQKTANTFCTIPRELQSASLARMLCICVYANSVGWALGSWGFDNCPAPGQQQLWHTFHFFTMATGQGKKQSGLFQGEMLADAFIGLGLRQRWCRETPRFGRCIISLWSFSFSLPVCAHSKWTYSDKIPTTSIIRTYPLWSHGKNKQRQHRQH